MAEDAIPVVLLSPLHAPWQHCRPDWTVGD